QCLTIWISSSMPYSRPQLFELSKKVGRSWRTLQYWASQGCDLKDPESLQRFLAEKNRKRTNVQKFRERRGIAQGASATAQLRQSGTFEPRSNGDSAVAGRRGAQHTLSRLEQQEAEAFERLQTALQDGDRFQIDACQTCSRPCAGVAVWPKWTSFRPHHGF